MSDHDDHALCSDPCGDQPTVWDLSHVPAGLKREWLDLETRRHLRGRGARALGSAGLASILGRTGPGLLAGPAPAPGAACLPARVPRFAPKAKRAIYLFMAGAPSQSRTGKANPGWWTRWIRSCRSRCAADRCSPA